MSTKLIMILLWLFTTTLSGSLGAIYLKKAMNEMPTLSMKNILTSKDFYIGSILYIVSAGTSIILFKHLQYSIAFPMSSISYIWTILISHFVFKEKITWQKIVAILFLIAGVICLGIAE
jgi:EamA-like transporter family.